MVTVVYGPPCSGKSTYVSKMMRDGDLACDVDSLYAAISGRDSHDADLEVHEVALKLHDKLLDIVRHREGDWNDAYVTSIAATQEQLCQIVERVNADACVLMDTPYETCMERAEERPNYFKFLIEEWFAERRSDGL